MHVRWQRSVTRITYSSKLIGIPSLAALFGLRPHPFGISASAVQKRLVVFVLKFELFRVYTAIFTAILQKIKGFQSRGFGVIAMRLIGFYYSMKKNV
ncbi:putative membrane protein [Pectobacterium atrosepticum SCRI1043]|uniref:Membrane protein n=1 Tax=Pectobacterium atrosepticum (strain SCRI 1043 / ATCC BAA-672) TaxID=218491 RepID=Q6CYP1_PECAS|nr:putative membrane protein [Pectobacterium atrosepticum SCRI1043]